MQLATLEDLKTYLGITNTTGDGELTRLLGVASLMAERYIDRQMQGGSRTEKRSGSGTDILMLRDEPVTAITALTIDGTAIPASDGTSAGYLFNESGVWLKGYTFCRGRRNVVVTYAAGYATTADVPADIQHAVIELAALAQREKDWIGFTSKSLAGETVSFARTAMPSSAKDTLDTYRRMHSVD